MAAEDLAEFEAYLFAGLPAAKLSRCGKIRACRLKLQKTRPSSGGRLLLSWGGFNGRGGIDLADIVEVKEGCQSEVFRKFGEDRCSDRYVSFVIVPNGDSNETRTLDLILESQAARDLVARCMHFLLSRHLGEHSANHTPLAQNLDDPPGESAVDHQGGKPHWGSFGAAGECVKGYLLKDSGGRSVVSKVYGKNWKRRYFVLDGNSLRYFTGEILDVMKGSIHLSDIVDVITGSGARDESPRRASLEWAAEDANPMGA